MSRDFKRTDRIADAIQKELSVIIQHELKDPRVGMVTLAGVKVARDLAHARIFVSVMFEETAQESIAALNNAAAFLRVRLAKRVQLRIMPQLSFVYDDTTVKANHLSRLIDAARASDAGPDESADGGVCQP